MSLWRGPRPGRLHCVRRVVGLGLLCLLASTSVAACITGGDPGHSYWVVNDSDGPVVVDIRWLLHETWVIAPHSYGGLVDTGGELRSGWTISLVDESCVPRSTWPIDNNLDLLYIGPTGDGQLTNGVAWEAGLRTAKAVDRVLRTPPCP